MTSIVIPGRQDHDVWKLCVYGLAGSGKSTVSAIIADKLQRRGLSCQVISLAEPLYQLQDHIYRTIGEQPGKDNELLRSIAQQLRRLQPAYLVTDFLNRVAACHVDVVINDDMRDADIDYPAMREVGFMFLRVTCDDETRAGRLRGRGDLTVVPDHDTTWGFSRITPEWSVDNSDNDPDGLHSVIDIIIDKWLTGGTNA